MPLMSTMRGGICGNPAVANGGINLPGSGDCRLSLNLKRRIFWSCYFVLINPDLGSQLQLYISKDTLFQF